MKDSEKSAELKRNILRLNFGKMRKQFDCFDDDRKVFCNTYDMLMEAINAMETIENNLIWIAFNNQYHKEYSELQSIADRF